MQLYMPRWALWQELGYTQFAPIYDEEVCPMITHSSEQSTSDPAGAQPAWGHLCACWHDLRQQHEQVAASGRMFAAFPSAGASSGG